jgi:serine/threonine protein kinase
LKRKREYYRKKEGGMAYKDQLQNVQMEIAIMKKLLHPNLIQLHEVIDDNQNDKLYMGKDIFILSNLYVKIVMDYAKFSEILKWDPKTLRFYPFDPSIDQFSEKDIRKYLRHCIRGLHYSKFNTKVKNSIANFYLYSAQ